MLYFISVLSPSRRREAPCEGTNSPRLFTPGETKALAESKVHQISRAWVTVRVSVTELYYITGGPARHQQVKPKTWRILRHCHDYLLVPRFMATTTVRTAVLSFRRCTSPPWFQHRYFMISLVFEVKIALKILIFFS
jgi:hypothetical protein